MKEVEEKRERNMENGRSERVKKWVGRGTWKRDRERGGKGNGR